MQAALPHLFGWHMKIFRQFSDNGYMRIIGLALGKAVLPKGK
jgi:hypothetical protein